MSLVFGGYKISKSPHQPARLLSLFRGLNWVQSYIPTIHCFLKVASLKMALLVGMVGVWGWGGECTFYRQGQG